MSSPRDLVPTRYSRSAVSVLGKASIFFGPEIFWIAPSRKTVDSTARNKQNISMTNSADFSKPFITYSRARTAFARDKEGLFYRRNFDCGPREGVETKSIPRRKEGAAMSFLSGKRGDDTSR